MQLPSPIPHPLEFLDAPGWMREALEWVLGVDWPEGDEKQVWDTADLWFQAAQALVPPYQDASSAANDVVAGWGGLDTTVAAAFHAAWSKVGGNDQAAFAALSSVADGIGELTESCGCDIQAAKIETYVELGLLLIELAGLAIAAACTFGTASAAAGPAMFATRMAIQQIFKRLMMKLLRTALKEGAEEAAERMAKVASKRAVSFAARTGRHALEEGLEELAVDYGVQSYQIGQGRRDGYDAGSLLTSFTAGAAGGAAGGLAGLGPSAESALGRFGENLVRGAAGEVLAETGASLTTGQGLPDAGNLARSATSGLASGGIQHAHQGFEHNLEAKMAALDGDFRAGTGDLTAGTGGVSASAVTSAPPATTFSAPAEADGPGGAADSAGYAAATHHQSAGQHTAAMPDPTGPAPGSQPSGGVNPSLAALAALSPDGHHPPQVQAALDQQAASTAAAPAAQFGGPGDSRVTLASHTALAPGDVGAGAAPSPGQQAQPSANPAWGTAGTATVAGNTTPVGNPTVVGSPSPAFGAPVTTAAGPSVAPTTATQPSVGVSPYGRAGHTPVGWASSPATTHPAAGRPADTAPAPVAVPSTPPVAQQSSPPVLDPALSRQIGDAAEATWNRQRTQGNWHDYETDRSRREPDSERPDLVVVSDSAHGYLNREVLPTAQGGVTAGNRSALTGTDNPPPVETTRAYGQRGGLREPLAYDQLALEQAMPRDEYGNVVRWADVEQPWFKLANDGGFEADPTRGLNCIDTVLSFYDTWAHGRPRVAAPRTFDAYAYADPNRPVGGERGGLQRARRTLGSEFTTVYTEATATYDTPQAIFTERMTELSRALEVAGPGSFAMIVNTWGLGGAHAWAAVNQNGSIRFVDPQNGFVYDQPMYSAEGSYGGVNRVDVIVLDPDGRPVPVAADDSRQPLRQWEESDPTGTGSQDGHRPRYQAGDLEATGKRDSTYGRELMLGPDGNQHFPGDPVGTFRNDDGQLKGEGNRYVTDDNRPPTDGLQARAVPDLDSVRTYSADGNTPVDQALLDAVSAREQVAHDREALWDSRIEPLAARLRPYGIAMDAASFGKEKFKKLLRTAEPYLSPAELLELRSAGMEYAGATLRLNRASEQLGTAGGKLVVAREFDGSLTLTPRPEEEAARGTPDNLDRVVLYVTDSSNVLVAIEEKGAGSGLGGRFVEDSANPGLERIRAEQCSPEYLRHMLQNDTKLEKRFRDEPDLRAAVQDIVSGPNPDGLRYLLVQTSESGVVTVTDYRLDPNRLGRDTIRLAGSAEEHEDG
ncbi:toxin glutamine deamidase domain-containing protein [Planosporangium mesophilum]|uniref:Tox-PL domain-containing protein n=1 Tax=Planosporangium mesophilum TaxID=689768 RepID=A0A8J3X187_9ACTN|nr:toxin glutamine deamidase domain-containing protein [Planosporangium mesophilum]NJC86686.1 hypothetical protein [Planosporangium mesophilum]GII24112.1 hypothetical protein Pme01_37090 [Planosporangium mesophilum]